MNNPSSISILEQSKIIVGSTDNHIVRIINGVNHFILSRLHERGNFRCIKDKLPKGKVFLTKKNNISIYFEHFCRRHSRLLIRRNCPCWCPRIADNSKLVLANLSSGIGCSICWRNHKRQFDSIYKLLVCTRRSAMLWSIL